MVAPLNFGGAYSFEVISMIVDKLENVARYGEIPEIVIDFISSLKTDIESSKYQLNSNDYANVETYNTKLLDSAKFEAHKKYIDIQILLSGRERIYVNDAKNLMVNEKYNAQKDIEFYSNFVGNSDYVTLDGSNFVMLYPHEAHAPQVALNNNPEIVKKVVIKILFS